MADDAVLLDQLNDSRTPESSLRDHLERIAHLRSGRFAVQIHLSRLRPQNRQPHHIRIAARTFDSLLNSTDSQLYTLTEGDLVLMCRDVRVDDADYVINKVRTLFRNDHASIIDRSTGKDEFTTWYDLTVDYEDLAETVAVLSTRADRRQRRGEDASAGLGNSAAFLGQALDPTGLAKIDDSVRQTRIADMIREQAAVIIGADGTESVLFRENYVSISDLQARFAPGINLASNVWLFQHLTETIDQRLLAALTREEAVRRSENISINLNISTVLSSAFQNFDRSVGDDTDKVVIELQQVDVFADMDSYIYARDWLRDRGYRVLVDGLSPRSLKYFNPGMLESDYVKVGWGPELSDDGSVEEVAEMMEIVDSIGANRFILARTDSEAAVKWALVLGIRRFQGFFIDNLVARQIAKEGKLAGSVPKNTRAK